ncbi:MAG: L-tyrosine/L-tryptophan isonitrile synthase family protein [Candidatus Nomurabacteria bacterium]|nr:MAG: L-tyrosine/L-tryptophan isonitrile synthase family protein [Candidatus Nomurabacteria bacterium]
MKELPSPSQYLQHKLETCGQYTLTESDHALLKEKGMEEFLYAKLTSKKFRKWRITQKAEDRIRNALSVTVPKNKPLQLRFPFGAYKLWRLPSSPEVDWAEFFTLAYFSEFLAPILAAYQPGVELYFSSDEVIVEPMNNVSREETDAYQESFRRLLAEFKKYWPNNFIVDIRPVRNLYNNAEEIFNEAQQMIPIIEERYAAMSKEEVASAEKTSAMNIRWDGVQDWQKLTEDEKKEKIHYGTILHDAYCAISKRQQFMRSDDTILLFVNRQVSDGIPLGSTKNSIAKFWPGYGVLEQKEAGYIERVLTPQQLTSLQHEKAQIEAIDWLPMKNFHEIQVYPELNFTLTK